MKVKYLGTLFAASVFSLGLLTSCATPEGGKTGGDAPADSTAPADSAAPADPAAPADGTGK